MESNERDEIQKVWSKIPKWFRNPQQINAKILMNYILLSRGNTVPVRIEVLERNYDLDSKRFITNYHQMKIIAERNHAKVFTENRDGTIELWDPVADFIIQEYKKVFG